MEGAFEAEFGEVDVCWRTNWRAVSSAVRRLAASCERMPWRTSAMRAGSSAMLAKGRSALSSSAERVLIGGFLVGSRGG